jgi:hypothetical protein
MKALPLLRSLFGRKLLALAALALMTGVTAKPAHAGWMVEAGCVDIQYNSCVHFTHVWYNTGTGQIIVFHFTYGGNWVEYWN